MKRILIICFSICCCWTSQAAQLRLMTLNSHSIGSLGSGEYNALSRIVERVCPDVVVFQEVMEDGDTENLTDLAADTGFSYFATADISSYLAGYMMNACMSHFEIESAVSWSAADISGDANANDICRDIFECRIKLPNGHYFGVVTVHLKAMQTDLDKFRRQIELFRTRQVLNSYRALYPSDLLTLAGDFNENYDEGPFGSPFWNSLPSGLPSSYELGNDISFPITYDPFETILSLGFTMVDATWEDSVTIHTTYPDYDSRIDYIFWINGPGLAGDEVYYSTQDNGVDDPPVGNWLIKCGTPPPSSSSDAASDHLAVFADLEYSSGPTNTPGPTASPTITPVATVTFTARPSATPSAVPPTQDPITPPPQRTATPSPTPANCMGTGVTIWMPSHEFHPGDPCECRASVCNQKAEPLTGYPLFVILDIEGCLFFAPSFTSYDNYLDDLSEFRSGETEVIVVPEFTWPVNAGSGSGVRWMAALTDPAITFIFGSMSQWEFGWSESQ